MLTDFVERFPQLIPSARYGAPWLSIRLIREFRFARSPQLVARLIAGPRNAFTLKAVMRGWQLSFLHVVFAAKLRRAAIPRDHVSLCLDCLGTASGTGAGAYHGHVIAFERNGESFTAIFLRRFAKISAAGGPCARGGAAIESALTIF